MGIEICYSSAVHERMMRRVSEVPPFSFFSCSNKCARARMERVAGRWFASRCSKGCKGGFVDSWSSQAGILHATEATNTALLTGGLSLHLLGDLDVDLEELADATVEADGLALVEIALAVGVGNTLLGAGLDKTVKLVSTRCRYDSGLLCSVYRLYMSETMSISASAAAIFSAEEGWGRPPPKRKDILI